MQPRPVPPTPLSLAPGVAARFTVIIASLIALVARAFLRDPALAPIIIPLRNRLARTARRFAALMAQLAQGKRPRGDHRPGKSGPHHPGPRMPTGEAWLVTTLGHEAAGFASQLRHLLAEPGVPEFLAATPAASHLLRPLCRMLGISPAALCAVGRDSCASSRTESPDTPARGVASQATGVFGFKNPESAAERPPAHPIPRPPCSHLQLRWPWLPRVSAKPT